jgi:hypothetical protein
VFCAATGSESRIAAAMEATNLCFILNLVALALFAGLVRERQLQHHTILAADHARDVTLAGCVFDEVNGSQICVRSCSRPKSPPPPWLIWPINA